MAKTKDWWPTSRNEQLAMAKEWARILAEVPANWEVSEDEAMEFITFAQKAEEALGNIRNRRTRTPIAREECDEAFEILEASARDLKRRRFHVPPLKRSDLIALLLKTANKKPTSAGMPTAQATVQTYLKGRYQLGFKIVFWSGDADDKANKGFRVYYKVTDHGEAAPDHPSQLTESYFTSKKRDVLYFDPSDRGKKVHIAVQIENGKLKGPWGPMVSDFIP